LTGTELWSMPMSAVCTPPAAPTILSSQNPSCGEPVILDAGPGYASYLWSTGETTRTITVAPTTTTAYTVYTGNAAGCRSSSTFMQTVNTSMVPPSPVASNNGAICAGQTLQLSATTVSGASYLWIGPNGFSSIQQNPQIPAASPAASGVYQVVAVVGSCEAAPASTNAVVRAGPSATIAAGVVACLSATNNASVPDAGAGATYSWTITNATITAGTGTRTITYTSAAPGTVSLGVTVTDANTCSSSSNRSVPMQMTC